MEEQKNNQIENPEQENPAEAEKTEEVKPEENNPEENKPEEETREEPKTEAEKSEEPKPEEVKSEEPKTEEAKSEEEQQEEPKAEEAGTEEVKPEEAKPEEEAKPKKPIGKTVAKVFGGIVGAAIICAAGYYGYGAWYYGTHFYEGTTLKITSIDGSTTVAEEDISGMSLKNAEGLASSYTDDYTLTISSPEKGTTDTISAADINYCISQESLDAMAAAVKAQDNWLWVKHMTAFAKASVTQTVDACPAYDADKLEALYTDLVCINPPQEEQGSDAYLSYNEDEHLYEIIPEVSGNMGDQEKIAAAVEEALNGMSNDLELTNDDYHLPEVTSEDEFLNTKLAELNKYLSAKITLKDGDKTLVVDGSVIEGFLDIDDEWNVTIDEDKVASYINANYDSMFDTNASRTRTITTPGSGTFTVSGGTLNRVVSTSKEKAKLIEEIENGETAERKPEYYNSYEKDSNGGIGDTYIDVNISTQTVYVVKNGSIAFTTSCVTGTDTAEHRTPTGVYYVVRKATEYTMVKYNAFVHYWMPINDATGVGLHDATWRSSFGGSIYKSSGSHGCINLPLSAAATIYNMVSTGIPVVVHY